MQYTYDEDDINHTHLIENPPKCETISNAIILPRKTMTSSWGLGGVIDNEGNFVELSRDESFGGAYEVDESDIITIDEDVLYLGYCIEHWGMFLIDFTRRLYWYFSSNKKEKIKIAFCGIGFEKGSFGRLNEKCYDFFNCIGIDRTDILDVRQPTRFNKVYVPEKAFDFRGGYFKQYILPFQKCLQYCKRKYTLEKSKKTYLSRTRLRPRKEFGEVYIEKFFRKNGWEIVYLEELDFVEQVKVIAESYLIASIEGTLAHNILFADGNMEQVIIKKRSAYNKRQGIINEISEIEAKYIDCSYELIKVDHDSGPFLILFNKMIRKYAKDNDMKYSKSYMCYNMIAILEYLTSILFMYVKKVMIKCFLNVKKYMRIEVR